MGNVTYEQALTVVQALLPEDKQRLRQWLLEEERQQRRAAANGASQPAPDFEREQRWLSEHQQEYVGQWVALEGDRLLSHGEDLNKVFDEAKAQGVQAPFTAFIEDPNQPWTGGW
jgi:aspartokinase